MKISEVLVHAMDFQVPLFLSHQQVMELVAILVVSETVQMVLEVLEVHQVLKEHQDHQRRYVQMDNWSHLLLHFQA